MYAYLSIMYATEINCINNCQICQTSRHIDERLCGARRRTGDITRVVAGSLRSRAGSFYPRPGKMNSHGEDSLVMSVITSINVGAFSVNASVSAPRKPSASVTRQDRTPKALA
jgi:hypothetical protein